MKARLRVILLPRLIAERKTRNANKAYSIKWAILSNCRLTILGVLRFEIEETAIIRPAYKMAGR